MNKTFKVLFIISNKDNLENYKKIISDELSWNLMVADLYQLNNTLAKIKNFDSYDCILLDYSLFDSNDLFTLSEFDKNLLKGKPLVIITSNNYLKNIIEAMDIGYYEILINEGLTEAVLMQTVINAIRYKKKHIPKEIELRKYEYAARHDYLTRLLNKYSFYETAKLILSYAKRHNKKLFLLFLDVDSFKLINDTYGHKVGDKALIFLSDRVKSMLRMEDVFARLSGDEFVILLTGIDDEANIKIICEKIIKSLNKPFLINSNIIKITVSIGISSFPEMGNDVEGLINIADQAMYKVKQSGKNGYKFASKEIDNKLHAEADLKNNLEEALKKNTQLSLYYQPIYNLKNNEIIGLEVLCRWNNPDWGVISPEIFINIAEKTGLYYDLGKFVIENSCISYSSLLKSFNENVDLKLSINFTSNQIKNQKLLNFFLSELKKYNIDKKNIEIEIKEHILGKNAFWLKQIKDLNFQLVIDDFGKDVSSIRKLLDYPVSSIKIDQSVIRKVLAEKKEQDLISAIIDMGKILNIRVIVSGVEEKSQLELLKKLGCEYAQGYYLSRPSFLEDINIVKNGSF